MTAEETGRLDPACHELRPAQLARSSQWDDTVLHGDCAIVLKSFHADCIDFVLTDPPYAINYQDRRGRTILNDHDPRAIVEAFKEIGRVLKPNSFCVSFYAWQHVDAFAAAWNAADLKPVGHIVFSKKYASGQRYLRYSHECAYLLAKGTPELLDNPVSDLMPWHYSGNHRHPTEKSVDILKPIIEAFTKAGDLILDPYAGSGSTLVAAALSGRHYVGVELEEKYCALARRRLEGVQRHLSL